MIRTAFRTTVREAGDLSAGVFDLKGRMLAQAVTGTPGHVNSMMESVGHFLAKFPVETMREGDHYITNDPWLGTGHLHDLTVVSPRSVTAGSSACSRTPPMSSTSAVSAWGRRGGRCSRKGSTFPSSDVSTRAGANETFFDFLRAGSRLPSNSRATSIRFARATTRGRGGSFG